MRSSLAAGALLLLLFALSSSTASQAPPAARHFEDYFVRLIQAEQAHAQPASLLETASGPHAQPTQGVWRDARPKDYTTFGWGHWAGRGDPDRKDYGTEGFYPPHDYRDIDSDAPSGYVDQAPFCLSALEQWQKDCTGATANPLADLKPPAA